MTTEVSVLNLGFVNAFLIRAGSGYVLIDTGLGAQWPALEEKLLAARALPDNLNLVVITHGDFDHTGNCAKLQKKYRAKIAMHPGDWDQAQTGKPLIRTPGSRMGSFLRAVARFPSRFRPQTGFPPFEVFKPDIPLESGQNLSSYGLDAKVLHTPGHTKGSIAILTGDGQLFPGDTFTNTFFSHAPPLIQDRKELRESIGMLKGLNAKMVYPGHGKPFPFEEIRKMKI
jgi:hydroxyacylglutathione hydrolase